MATIHIEQYRGYDIMFNTNSEKFQSDIDNGKDKNSLSSARKEIDDYMKNNQNFKPVKVFNSYSFEINQYNYKAEVKTIVSLRKDNAFQFSDKTLLSNYDIEKSGNWFLLDETYYKDIMHILDNLRIERDKLMNEVKIIENKSISFVEKLKGQSVKEFRDKLLGQ